MFTRGEWKKMSERTKSDVSALQRMRGKMNAEKNKIAFAPEPAVAQALLRLTNKYMAGD